MSFDIKLPSITATTDSGKIEQIHRYLYQLVDQLKWALNSIETGGNNVLQRGTQSSSKNITQEEANATFNSIKSLIISSADVVNAFYEKVSDRSDRFWESLGLSDNVSASEIGNGRYKIDDCCYRVVNEKHVYVAFNCQFTFNNQSVVVSKNPIPKEYRPARNVYAMCATGGKAIARVFVTTSGNVGIDWIQSLTSGEETTSSEVYWIDGYIDYWV